MTLTSINEAMGVLVLIGLLLWALGIVANVLYDAHREAGMLAVAWLLGAAIMAAVCIGTPAVNGLDLFAKNLAENFRQNTGQK